MFVVIKKRSLVLGIVLCLLLVVLLSAMSATDAAAVFTGNTKRKLPVYRVETSEKVVALTFDAAWGADKTTGIVELLNQYDAKATFFLVGFWLDKYPEETKMLAAEGIEIGNHSNNHLKMSGLSREEITKEISSVNT